MEDILVKVTGYTFEKLFDKDIVSLEDVFNKLEEEHLEVKRLEEELEDLKQNVKDNFKPLSNKELYGDIEVL